MAVAVRLIVMFLRLLRHGIPPEFLAAARNSAGGRNIIQHIGRVRPSVNPHFSRAARTCHRSSESVVF
jgi:hypothetical protein